MNIYAIEYKEDPIKVISSFKPGMIDFYDYAKWVRQLPLGTYIYSPKGIFKWDIRKNAVKSLNFEEMHPEVEPPKELVLFVLLHNLS